MTPDTAATHRAASTARLGTHALRWAVGAGAVLACLLVFGLYTAPDFMVMLADQMWACF